MSFIHLSRCLSVLKRYVGFIDDAKHGLPLAVKSNEVDPVEGGVNPSEDGASDDTRDKETEIKDVP